MSGIFDSHSHYINEAFDQDRINVLNELPLKGVCGVIECCDSMQSIKKALNLAEQIDYMYVAVGVHPHEVGKMSQSDILEIAQHAKNKKVVAIGEIGLDYHYDFCDRAIQKKWFEEQLILAVSLNLPVVVHDREAHEDTLRLLQRHKPRGVVHCFSSGVEMATEIVKLGMYIGIGGALTFKNARRPVEVVESIALESLLLETDCPYMTPVPFRGKRCDSSHIINTAQKISELKNIKVEDVINTTCLSVIKLFGINSLR